MIYILLFFIYAILFFLQDKIIKCDSIKKELIKKISTALFIVLLLELSLFNYKHYLTMFNKPVTVNDYQVENMVQVEEGYISTFKDGGSIVIPTNNVNLNSIYINIYNKSDKLMTYIMEVYDLESNKYIYINNTNTYRGVETSYYKTLHNKFKTDKIKITMIDSEDSIYKVNSIKLNPVIPIKISYVRIVLLFGFILLCYLLKAKDLFNIKVNSDKKAVNKVLVIFAIATISIVFIFTNLNRVFVGNYYYSIIKDLYSVNEYQLLAESLSKGKTYLEIEPSEDLKNLNNPYNYEERKQKGQEYFLWDAAYYKNHYYVYFGVVPVIFTYLPFYMITGHHINNNTVVFIGLVGIIISLIVLLKKLIQKYYPNVTLGTFLLLLTFLVFGNHFVIMYAAKRPDFYSIPIIWGIMFTLIGLNLWFSSIEKNKINKVKLALGSLSMALVAGCRPQLLLVSFLSILIFFKYFKKKWNKETIKEALCFALPYIIVAILLMIYNYVRFGSPFDFGANYNLTTNDMTKRGFNIERIGLGLYYYLFCLPRGTNVFPFFEMVPLSTSYLGTTIYEPMFGGLLVLYPILWLNILVCKFKKLFKEKLLYKLCILLNLFALIIIITDTNMAGILPRYNLDYTWMLFLSSIIIIFTIFEHYKDNKPVTKELNKVLYIFLIVSLIINFFMLFIDVLYSYKSTLPTIYYNLYYLIQFWL